MDNMNGCVYCGTTDIDYIEEESNGDTLTRIYSCDACGKFFKKIYTINFMTNAEIEE